MGSVWPTSAGVGRCNSGSLGTSTSQAGSTGFYRYLLCYSASIHLITNIPQPHPPAGECLPPPLGGARRVLISFLAVGGSVRFDSVTVAIMAEMLVY